MHDVLQKINDALCSNIGIQISSLHIIGRIIANLECKYEQSEKQFRSNDTSLKNLKGTDKSLATEPVEANHSTTDLSTEPKYKDATRHKCTTNTSDKDEEEAAVRIQAVYKGYIVRSKSRDRHVSGVESPNIDIDNEEANRAAIKIQSVYRGHLTRRRLASTSGKEQEVHTSEK